MLTAVAAVAGAGVCLAAIALFVSWRCYVLATKVMTLLSLEEKSETAKPQDDWRRQVM